MKKMLSSLLLLIVTVSLLAQNVVQNENVKGRVVDTSTAPISGVTVVMFASDSTYVASTISDVKGVFEIPLNTTSFQLQFNHISFERLQQTFKNGQVGDIVLIQNILSLDEITIKAYRPMVKVEEGKLSYNMEQLTGSTIATNVYEALSYLPGIDENNGVLSLAGIGVVKVIINGKPTSMSTSQLETTLRSMPIDRIKSAEVMYSTPPQYGVRGAAINLIMEQSRDNSYSGELHTGYGHQHKNSWNSGGSFAISTPTWSADVIYGYNNYYSPLQSQLTTTHTVGEQKATIQQIEDMQSMGEQHTLRAAFDYTPTEKSSLSIVYNSEITPTQHSISNSDGSFVESVSNKRDDIALHNIALRYKAKSGFDIGIDYTSYNNHNDGYLNNLYADSTTSSFDIRSGQHVSRLNFYANMEHTLGSGWDLNYGMQGAWAEDKDFQHYNTIVGEVETFDTNSHLTEWTSELYVGFGKKLKKGSISTSLTGEYYNLKGEQRWMLYPQANFMWMFNQDNILQANITSDKTYPSYWMLQDAITHVDGYTELHGNPLLRPMQSYASQFVYIYKKRYIFVLFASQTEDYFTQNAYLSPDRFALIYKNINFDYARQYGANIMIPFNIDGWLSSKATLTGLRMKQRCDNFYDLSFDRSAWVGVLKINNTVKLSKNFSIEVNGIYQSPAIQGLFDLEQSWGVDAGFKLSLLDNALNITAKCNDIFESRMPRVTQNWQGQKLSMYTGRYNRTFTLNLSYTFGSYTKKKYKEVETSRFGH